MPLSAGNSGFSWSDVLLGDLPNVYVYAANNPSESIIAKRRGYGTIVSHNVPPYGRHVPWPYQKAIHPVRVHASGSRSCDICCFHGMLAHASELCRCILACVNLCAPSKNHFWDKHAHKTVSRLDLCYTLVRMRHHLRAGMTSRVIG